MAAGVPSPPERAGFGNCPECAYAGTGPARACFECANATIEPVSNDQCKICDGILSDGECGNPLCRRSEDERAWSYIYAIAMRSGELERVISNYKYEGTKGWAWIFGRMLAAYLEELLDLDPWDLIIPMPTLVEHDGMRDFDHVGLIVERAEIEAPELPFRRGIMRKTRSTPRLVEQPTFAARAHVAETEFGPSLEVIDRAAVAGRTVLVFDDVFTSGLTLREVARKLIDSRARAVGGVVLARQPFRA